jgi:tetratricopeptide (TPR) repeat protein
MHGPVFVRPNLKMLMLGAVALLIVQHLISSAHSQAPALELAVPVNAREVSDEVLQGLIKLAAEKPSADAFLRISNCYEKRGDYRKALQYLRRAEKFGQVIEAGE